MSKVKCQGQKFILYVKQFWIIGSAGERKSRWHQDADTQHFLSHLGWTALTHCWVARRPATSIDCRWHRIHLPELYVRHRVPPTPPNYDGSSTGCLFDSGSLTSWRSSPTARDQRAHQSTWPTSSKTTTHLAPCDQLKNCLYHRWH